MRWIGKAAAALAVIAAVAAPARAQDGDGPRFCPNRPDLGSSGCITEPGHVQLEVSAVDWQRDDAADARGDRTLVGDVQLRLGLDERTEVQVSWTPFVHDRTRDRPTGAVAVAEGVGDVRLAVRRNLRHPDGKDLSLAVEPFVTVPIDRIPVGDGDWGAGVVLPVSYDLGDAWQVAFTGELDAAVDEDGRGRHFAAQGIAGLQHALTDKVDVVGELLVRREGDPADVRTEVLAASSLAWQPRHGLQLDLLAAAGLNRDTPDLRVLTGGAIVF